MCITKVEFTFPSTIMATCRDLEGWRAVSRLREFDTTPCFQEGILLPSLLATIFFVSTARSLVILFKDLLEKIRKSIQVLNAKLYVHCISFV